ncbi:MAG: hypothetical protein II721_00185 [Bacilli bacterium]|nr:hypothetical protein [Bacilli bacterium]
MKKIVAILTLPLLVSSLSSCFPDDGKWKAEFGDPVLFMDTVIVRNNPYHYGSCFYHYAISEAKNLDKEFIVANAIKDAGPFSEARKKDNRSERFFTYQGYWVPATSGPNYCNLALYEDGFIEIVHKDSLGPYGYLYFETDPVKAKYVVDLAFEMLLAPNPEPTS